MRAAQLQSPLRRWGLQRPPAITRIKCTMPAMVEPQLLGPMPPPSAKSVTPLTHLQLEAFLREKGIQGRLVPGERAIDAPGVVKSLVFLARGQPVLVVLAGADKVDEKKLAAYLQVARRRVALAAPDKALSVSGYLVGTVPPLGHLSPLRTILDLAVTQQPMVIGGSGAAHLELEMPVPELLHATGAEVADVAVRELPPAAAAAAGPGGAAGLPLPWPAGSRAVQLVGVVAQRRRIAKMLLFASIVPEEGLPPIQSGAAAYMRRLWCHPDSGRPAEVQLILGKTLERNLGREGTAALMDRVKNGTVVSVTGVVQPHLPKRNRLAADGNNSTATDTNSSSSSDRGGGGSSGDSTGSDGSVTAHAVYSDTLDVVVHHMDILYKTRDTLERALMRARRAVGPEAVSSARELQQLRRFGNEAFLASFTQLPGSSVSSSEEDSSEDEVGKEQSGSPFPPAGRLRPTAAGASGKEAGGNGNGSDNGSEGSAGAVGAGEGAAAPGAGAALASRGAPESTAAEAPLAGAGEDLEAESPYWQLAIGTEAVVWVDDLEGVHQMRQAVLGVAASCSDARHSGRSSGHQGSGEGRSSSRGGGGNDGDGSSSSTSGSSSGSANGTVSTSRQGVGHASLTVVGLDCEWVPYDRGNAKTPVALLQVALRHQVFLVDLLTLCGAGGPRRAAADDAHDGAHSGAGMPGNSGSGSAHAGSAASLVTSSTCSGDVSRESSSSSSSSWPAATEGGMEVGRFLVDLMARPDVAKVGFGLASDLARLRESYPWMPCFQQLPQGGPSAAGGGPDAAQDTAWQQGQAGPGALGDAQVLGGAGRGQAGRRGAAGPWGKPLGRPLRLHVDVLLLVRALLPSMAHLPRASLSQLVEALLGKPLDKGQQRSDWGARPLSQQQWLYAAADAAVLVALYDELLRRSSSPVSVGLLQTLSNGLDVLPVSSEPEAGL